MPAHGHTEALPRPAASTRAHGHTEALPQLSHVFLQALFAQTFLQSLPLPGGSVHEMPSQASFALHTRHSFELSASMRSLAQDGPPTRHSTVHFCPSAQTMSPEQASLVAQRTWQGMPAGQRTPLEHSFPLHSMTHAPPAHDEQAAGQAHSQPFAFWPSQSTKPALHDPVYVHVPELHATPPAFATVASQSFPHAPQLWTSVFVCVSHPVLPSAQCVYPGLQLQVHVLAVHAAAPFAVLQALSQAPQLRTSVDVSTQNPPQHVVPATGHVPREAQGSTQLPAGLHFLPSVQSPSSRHCTHW